jgi:hypothetical protein
MICTIVFRQSLISPIYFISSQMPEFAQNKVPYLFKPCTYAYHFILIPFPLCYFL